MQLFRSLAALALALGLLAGCEVPPGTTTTSASGAVTGGGLPPPPVAERIKPMPSPGPNKVLAVVDISDQRVTAVRGYADGRAPETYHWVASSGIERKPTPLGAYYPTAISPSTATPTPGCSASAPPTVACGCIPNRRRSSTGWWRRWACATPRSSCASSAGLGLRE